MKGLTIESWIALVTLTGSFLLPLTFAVERTVALWLRVGSEDQADKHSEENDCSPIEERCSLCLV